MVDAVREKMEWIGAFRSRLEDPPVLPRVLIPYPYRLRLSTLRRRYFLILRTRQNPGNCWVRVLVPYDKNNKAIRLIAWLVHSNRLGRTRSWSYHHLVGKKSHTLLEETQVLFIWFCNLTNNVYIRTVYWQWVHKSVPKKEIRPHSICSNTPSTFSNNHMDRTLGIFSAQ